jgi:hypothetical protein
LVGFNPTKATEKPAEYIIGLFKYMSAKRIMSSDNKSVRIDDHVYLGSIGAAANKADLAANKITHIITIAEGIYPPYPKV